MRVLLISHTYVARVNQPKLHELAALPGVELRVVVPSKWKEGLHGFLEAQPPENADFDYVIMPTFALGPGNRYVHLSLDLTMRRFQPDIVFVEEGWRGLTMLQAALCKRLWARRTKLVFFSWENIFQPLPRWQTPIARYNLRQIDGGICGNEDGVAVAREGGYRGPLSVVAQLGIDPEAFYPAPNPALRQKLGLAKDAFVIGFAARMVPEKGASLLVEAAAQAGLHGGWKLLLIGDGTERAQVEQRAAELGIADHLVMVGVVPHLELAGYYNIMDVLVSPSLSIKNWKEQFGLCVAQAMSCGVPVIGSTCGETPNLIGDAGLIFEQGQTAALATQLRRVQCDAVLRADLKQRGLVRMRENYSFAGIARRTHQVWKELLHA